jgi:hypothetical protein
MGHSQYNRDICYRTEILPRVWVRGRLTINRLRKILNRVEVKLILSAFVPKDTVYKDEKISNATTE